jgi:hypothetical protein
MSNDTNSHLFRSNLCSVVGYLQNWTEKGALHFGPVYDVHYKDRRLNVKSFFSEIGPNYHHPYHGRLIMTVGEHENEVTGVGNYGISYKPDEGYIEGTLDIFPKNKGYCMPFVLALLDIFQRESNRLQKPVTWNVRNNNHDFMDCTLMGTWNFGDGDYRTNLDQAKMEQTRWLAVFGPGGKIGCRAYEYDLSGRHHTKKTFQPSTPEDMEKLGRVCIVKNGILQATSAEARNGNADLAEETIRKLLARNDALDIRFV